MKVLWVDDIRKPVYKDADWALNYNAAIFMLKHNKYDVIDFDHDLGTIDNLTGYDIAKWMVSQSYPTTTRFKIHSMNPVGAHNIRSLLLHYGFEEMS